jgi:nicotinate-nucleotide adenylyltransferase
VSAGENLGRLGILGGTFDPPHVGHLVLAENARVQLALDRILFVLAGQPPHKPRQPITGGVRRAEMVEAAIAGNDAFCVSRVDLERPGPHYTVDTLALLHDRHPDAEFFFLMGGDSLEEFPHWRDAPGILRQTRLAVMPRWGARPDMERLERAVPGISQRLSWLDVPTLDISSTELRRRVRQDLPLRYLVPAAVETYIQALGLYEENAA